MTPNDDIPGLTPDASTAQGDASATNPRHRSVGPESENRGGSEAPDATLGQTAPPDTIPDGVPGSRAALPEGSLPAPFLGPQGDENRGPPANAPVATGPGETVESALQNARKLSPDRG
jgi:hypothetical protein